MGSEICDTRHGNATSNNEPSHRVSHPLGRLTTVMPELTLLLRPPTKRLGDDVLRVASAAARAPTELVDLACQMVLTGGPPRGWQQDAACRSTTPTTSSSAEGSR